MPFIALFWGLFQSIQTRSGAGCGMDQLPATRFVCLPVLSGLPSHSASQSDPRTASPGSLPVILLPTPVPRRLNNHRATKPPFSTLCVLPPFPPPRPISGPGLPY